MFDLDLVIFIKCSGDNARPDNLHDTIASFEVDTYEDLELAKAVGSIIDKGNIKCYSV